MYAPLITHGHHPANAPQITRQRVTRTRRIRLDVPRAADDARPHSKSGEFVPEELAPRAHHAARHRGDAVITDRDDVDQATMIDPLTQRRVMVFETTLPAIDMGLGFVDVGDAPCVQRVVPGGRADLETPIKPGDVLIRCTATEMTGDTSTPAIQRIFNCHGEDFDTCMRALNSTGIVDTGFIHRRVHVMFKRDIEDVANHEREDEYLHEIARKGRLEVDREAHAGSERPGADVPAHAEPLYEDSPPAWDD